MLAVELLAEQLGAGAVVGEVERQPGCNDRPVSDASTQAKPRPARGEELELDVDTLAYGGRGVARSNGYVVFVEGALPGDRVRAAADEVQARLRARRERSRSCGRAATGSRDAASTAASRVPGAPWQELPYELQLSHKRDQVADALRRIGGLEGFDLEPAEPAVEPWRYRNKLEYSFGDRDGEPVLGFHARGRWDRILDVDDCLLASEANNAARNEVRDWARGVGTARRTTAASADRRASQPRRARGTADGAAADPARHLGGRDPAPAGRPPHGDRGPVGRHRRRDRRARARVPRGGALRAAAADLARRLLPDQHRDGRAPVLGRRRLRRASTAASACSTSTAASERIGLALREPRRRGLGDRDRRRRRSPTRRRTRAATGSPTRASSPRDARLGLRPLRRAGRAPRRRRRRPAARRAVEEDRPAGDRVRGAADRLRLLQPDDAGAERRPARRGRI